MVNIVLFIGHFIHKEGIFYQYIKICIDCRPSSTWKIFSELEKKWSIPQFAKTPSPSTVHREFILHFKISRRAAKSYQLIQLTRVLDYFNETSSIHIKKTNEIKIKKNRSRDSGDEEFLWRISQLLTWKNLADFIHQNHVVEDF